MHTIYECLVRLHPQPFRTRFGDDMIWIFDQITKPAEKLSLIQDAIISVLRQWLLRHQIDLFEAIRVTLDFIFLPSVAAVALIVFGQSAAFFMVGGPPVQKIVQVVLLSFSVGVALAVMGIARSLVLVQRAQPYVWLKLCPRIRAQ